ncbi:unnamed protein product [Rotaria sp. Silwood1]|nr:unnamed protein product [Rotaria sp. Silwood1]
MDTTNSIYLTPEQLETGLVNGTIDKLELEKLLTNNVHENENIDTLVHFFQHYIPGNRTMDEFIEKIRQYNSAQICGLVWNANVIAYRCKTCSISPCMSICAQCFQHGNHEGHNYNMFKSQAGGACDCGDSSVMHEFGFCRFHGENRPKTQMVPRELICCAELLIPHLLKVFIRALRMSTVSGDIVTEQKLLEILNLLSNGGSALQVYITNALTDRRLYEEFTTDSSMIRLYHYEYLTGECSTLPETFFVESLMTDSTSNSLIPFDTSLHTMLDEIMMWCVTANLPEDLVRFLLSLLPDFNFKLLFTETFLRFYGVIAQSLVDESLSETSDIPSRLVHISVQLFSSNIIAEYAMEKCHLIEVILSCIWHMFVPSTDQDKQDEDVDEDENILKVHPLALSSESSTAMVVDVDHRLIVKNVYWPLLSDFVNILSQEKIAFTILENQKYFNLWLRFLTLFQGMNVNERILTQHVEFEPQAYMYAFTIELEINAMAMWYFVSHLKQNVNKRQRAKNRQQKLLAEIAESQKKFISQQNPDENAMSIGTSPSLNNEHLSMEQTITTIAAAAASNISTHTENLVEYECCVCRITKSDSQSPIGLIGTSCLSLLPSLEFTQLDEYEQKILSYDSHKITLETYLNITKQCLTQISGHPYIANYCQNDHHLRSLLIQSCGHSIHVDCLSSYLKALHPNQEAAEVSVNNLLPPNTNFRCPLCRQTANALIPLFDYNDYVNIEENKQNVTSFERLHQSMLNPLRPKLKRSSDESCLLAFLSGLAAKCVSIEQLSADIPMSLPHHQSMKQRAAEFDCGTLRAQLVHEQLFYESANRIDQKNIRKSFYKILHDLHHLGYPFHHQHLWQELTGLQCPSTTIDVFDRHQPLAPILLRDPITMLLQLLMSAPINLTSDEFDTIVQTVFNIEFFKSLISIITEQPIENTNLADFNSYIDLTKKYIKDIITDEPIRNRKPIENSFEIQLMNNCLEFLKITSLIKYRLYSKEMPWITGEQPSAIGLANFLNLKLNLNGLAIPQWYCGEPIELVTNWLQDFQNNAQHHRDAMKILCLKRPHFYPPIFIDLPAKYDDIFHTYNEYRCEHCKKVSSSTLLCLICGELHLRRWYPACCVYQRQRYAQHLTKCGHPAAVMLDIQTTLIAICLTDTYGYWHSLYLDQHGEEDPKLKRGKTLYLNLNRLAVLRTLWLTATFDYQIPNWLSYMSLMISHFDVLL